MRKYGSEETYGKAKDPMIEALQVGKGRKTDLDTNAFHMYELFRPDVVKGQKGWGRKGELNLSTETSDLNQAYFGSYLPSNTCQHLTFSLGLGQYARSILSPPLSL